MIKVKIIQSVAYHPDKFPFQSNKGILVKMDSKKGNTKYDTQQRVQIDDYYNEAVWPGKLLAI